MCKFNFGQSNNDPMTNVKFYNKENPLTIFDTSDITKYVGILYLFIKMVDTKL